MTIGGGTVNLRAPRVKDKSMVDGQRQRFMSKLLPPYLRRSKRVCELLPHRQLRGLSTGDFSEALPVLLGDEAAGLWTSAITRLVSIWQQEHKS